MLFYAVYIYFLLGTGYALRVLMADLDEAWSLDVSVFDHPELAWEITLQFIHVLVTWPYEVFSVLFLSR